MAIIASIHILLQQNYAVRARNKPVHWSRHIRCGRRALIVMRDEHEVSIVRRQQNRLGILRLQNMIQPGCRLTPNRKIGRDIHESKYVLASRRRTGNTGRCRSERASNRANARLSCAIGSSRDRRNPHAKLKEAAPERIEIDSRGSQRNYAPNCRIFTYVVHSDPIW
jgi:hypothetical protein